MELNTNVELVKHWMLDSAIEVCRKWELILKDNGYHIALAGGVLFKGFSIKDLDIIIYPHHTDDPKLTATQLCDLLEIEYVEKRDHSHYDDDKDVHQCRFDGLIVDMFLLK